MTVIPPLGIPPSGSRRSAASPAETAEAIRRGDRRALARAITLIESTRADHRAHARGEVHRLGIVAIDYPGPVQVMLPARERADDRHLAPGEMGQEAFRLIQKALADAGFKVLSVAREQLRNSGGRPVFGMIFVAQKTA